MVHEAIILTSNALKAGLQDQLNTLNLPDTPIIAQFMNPFEDDELQPVNYPAIVVNLPGMRSPAADFAVNDLLHANIPIVIEYRTRDVDNSETRTSVSIVQRAIIHILSKLSLEQPTLHDVMLIEIHDLIFDFVKFDSEYTGGAVMFTTILRDQSDV